MPVKFMSHGARAAEVLLGFDTATAACTVAYWSQREVRVDHRLADRRHNSILLSMIEGVCRGLPAPTAVAFGCGPGSFTGVRIAASVAQGIGLGRQLPVVPVSTLAIIAAGVFRTCPDAPATVVCVSARRNEMYTSTFRRDGSVGGPPVAMTPAIAVAIHDFVAPALPAGTMLSGDAAAAVQHRLPALALAGWEHPHAEDLLAIARATLATDGAQDVASALPVYLEGSSAWRKSGAR